MIRAHFPRLRAIAAENGVAMGDTPPRLGIDTRPAHEVAKAVAAAAPERVAALHQAIYRAHFVDGEDIGSPAVLAAIAERAAAVPAPEIAEALAAGRFRAAVLDDEREAARRGVRGVPATFVGDELLASGFVPAPELRRVLDAIDAATPG